MKYAVITINYNHCDGLRKTIDSVVAQRCRDYEFIVIDGGSTDGSREVIEQYAASITYWVSEPDGGVYHAMNKGIRAASAEYLIFMNSGDTFFSPDVLEQALPYMHGDIVQGVAKNHDMSQTPLCLVNIPNRTEPFAPSLHHQSCFFRRTLFDIEPYDEHYRIVADWAFYIRQLVLHHASYSVMPVVVAVYEGGGISDRQKTLDFNERCEVIDTLCRQLKERGDYAQYEPVMLHLMFNSKMRFLLNRSLLDVDKFLDIYPQSGSCYRSYPFSHKQRFLFFLASLRMRRFLKFVLNF